MIYPIVIYGNPVLRKASVNIDASHPDFKKLVDDMWITLGEASGVGLAAPQVGLAIRLFILDLRPLADEEPQYKDYTKTFINPEIIDYSDETDTSDEGCLSIPGIHESVARSKKVLINYLDENFVEHEEWVEGFPARAIQHEYDHLEQKMFVDRINPIRKQLIKAKLSNVIKGRVYCDYKTKAQR